MSSNADKLDFGNEALSGSRQLEARGFIDDAEVAREERQRFAEVFCPDAT
jgi:hypothetical protein